MTRIKPEQVNGMRWRVIRRVGDNPKTTDSFVTAELWSALQF